MAMAHSQSNFVAGLFLQAVLVSVVMISSVQGDTTINLLNSCTEDLTACQTSSSGTIACYVLGANGGSYSLDVGTTWTGGVIWAFPASSGTNTTIGNDAKPQADLAEFTINANGEDSYDISLVNAYNLAMQISLPSPAGTPSGLTCTSITCSISDINSVCQSPNTFTGAPGEGCYNTDGPGSTSPTPGTMLFANVCPQVYTYSTDNANHVYGCPTTSNYQVQWCPS